MLTGLSTRRSPGSASARSFTGKGAAAAATASATAPVPASASASASASGIQIIPPEAAALLPDAIADSRRMFAAKHQSVGAESCHPALSGPEDPELHRALHDRMKLGAVPAASEPRAWEGFPERRGEARRDRMIELFAEEAMVLGAERSRRPEFDGAPHVERKFARWAVRALITSTMPEGLRYFGVNHYREIVDRIPAGWLKRGSGGGSGSGSGGGSGSGSGSGH